ncbi:interleukin-5 receptor subunit alpha-like [Betta splendens]|uniref:Interleukin-5 receptor subunit alpha-like n=1 Tax=Betta splendens TaxID=158456 RepID=A0A6P7L5Z9_BETSP|nr:interleukin-5 receptor subunit alpha-like [Betta splendens]
MKAFHPVLWSSFLFVCMSKWESEANHSDLCEEGPEHELIVSGSSFQTYHVHKHEVPEHFSCHTYPTNKLNCSWRFHTLAEGANLSVSISICKDVSWGKIFQEKEGAWSHSFAQFKPEDVVVEFNMSLADNWTAYTYMFNEEGMEVLSPPSNISISVKDGNLLVMWNQPFSHTTKNSNCFDYELDLGDKENIISLTRPDKLAYTELNKPTHTYKVRIRAKKSESCFEGPEWSEWSDTIMLEPTAYKLNMLVIISISLGIPMILLAVLLVVRHQRVSQLLFPPIPRPPPKYIHFLEKGHLPNLFYPAPSSMTEEEITEVEDTKET